MGKKFVEESYQNLGEYEEIVQDFETDDSDNSSKLNLQLDDDEDDDEVESEVAEDEVEEESESEVEEDEELVKKVRINQEKNDMIMKRKTCLK